MNRTSEEERGEIAVHGPRSKKMLVLTSLVKTKVLICQWQLYGIEIINLFPLSC